MQLRDDSKKGRRFLIPVEQQQPSHEQQFQQGTAARDWGAAAHDTLPLELLVQQQGLTQPGKQMFYGELPALFLGAAAAPTHSRL